MSNSVVTRKLILEQAMLEASRDIRGVERELEHLDREKVAPAIGRAIGLRVRQAEIGVALAELVERYLAGAAIETDD